MDLANAPDVTRTAYAAGEWPDRQGEMRLLSADSICTPQFVAAWQDLATHACEPNPYFEPWFVLPSLEAFAPQHVQLAAIYSEGVLVGLLPLARSNHYYGYPIPHLSTWSHANSFCGAPLVMPGHAKRFWRALIARMESGLGNAMFLHLPLLPIEGPLYAALNEVLAEDRRASAIVTSHERALLASDLYAEQYLTASMSAKKRKELRRQHKRLGEEGRLVFERLEDDRALAHWIDEFLELEAAGWKGEAASALAGAAHTRSFFTGALSGAARAGRLERLTLRLDDRPIGMLANFITPPGAYSFKTTFDERYARFSPGMLLQLENLDLLGRSDIAWADSCAAEGHPMIERLWRERRKLVGINIALGGPLRRAITRGLMAYETRNRSKP